MPTQVMRDLVILQIFYGLFGQTAQSNMLHTMREWLPVLYWCLIQSLYFSYTIHLIKLFKTPVYYMTNYFFK